MGTDNFLVIKNYLLLSVFFCVLFFKTWTQIHAEMPQIFFINQKICANLRFFCVLCVYFFENLTGLIASHQCCAVRRTNSPKAPPQAWRAAATSPAAGGRGL
jgi:hypothetical protein